MRLSKFLITLFIITTIALIYVHQQIKLVSLNLALNTQQESFNHLLDQNKYLNYNNLVLKSQDQVELKLLAKNILLSRPENWQVVNVEKPYSPVEIAKIKSPLQDIRNFALGFFSLGSKAEAGPQDRRSY